MASKNTPKPKNKGMPSGLPKKKANAPSSPRKKPSTRNA